MSNLLQFKCMICSENVKNEAQLGEALKKVEEYALIALRTKRIVGINLIELTRPKFFKHKDRKALNA